MDNDILISELEEANKIIGKLEGYEEKIDTIKGKMQEVEKNKMVKSFEITEGSIKLVVGTFFITVFIFCIHLISFFTALLIFIGSIILAIIVEIASLKGKFEDAEEYYQANMPVLKQGEEYYMKLAQELCYSSEFQWASNMIPQDYFDSESVLYLIAAIKNKRADSLKEAINLYEDHLHQKRLEEIQQQQLLAAQENNKIQQEQLEYAKQQLAAANEQAEYSRQIAKSTRSTARAVKLNTFITVLKK